ncbi:excinuclease ABC subunit UvrC [Candidatus Venteria ishoeyi]|uniref:UvrABC system protein C n=1 Tax=Candidatus Venteria ishoeyi TaxID=1899563 RepID=A0A1H6FB68_9GAMM|nr:excinuclease ABC subunit UvrC [Candidatus Venteria ishoeyi]SEH06376.1 UvrABC system protein C [Candidatus Venteria ishoeyi]
METSSPLSFDAKPFLSTVSQKPGVYQMWDATDEILYVGKAKNLKNRLSSYFRSPAGQTPKTRALVARIARIDVTITHTETEALLLENNLIKRHQPPYNILLRDDKSYPFIYLSAGDFPRLSFHRGTKRDKGRYFGPYPSIRSVHESLKLLQKLFPVRQCRDSFFRNRSRPCLQYQIKRCTAPCVGEIDKTQYQIDVQHAVLFLEGKSQHVIEQLVDNMQQAARQQAYERAAVYRDQIARLRQLQEHQYMETEASVNIDVLACVARDGVGCVQLLSIRDGRNLGSRAWFPKHTRDVASPDILAPFLTQYYLSAGRDLPEEIIIDPIIPSLAILQQAIYSQHEKKIKIHHKVRGARAKWQAMALQNAWASLDQHKPTQHRERLSALAVLLQMEELPSRLECFDISHTQGEATVASCVVFGMDGPIYNDYRRFNIKDVTAGDDYAAMKQVLTRRYSRLKKTEAQLPDIVVVDGGKGQLKQAIAVMEELQLPEIRLLGVAKGRTRKPGLEQLLLPDERDSLILSKDNPALHLIQHIRDESHRFAISGHRQRRAKQRKISVLEQIEGIGAKRRQNLINHFGGLQGVQRAGVEDLAQITGINQALAQKIYDAFH